MLFSSHCAAQSERCQKRSRQVERREREEVGGKAEVVSERGGGEPPIRLLATLPVM